MLLLAAALGLATSGAGCAAGAEEGPALPGMCSGRSDPDTSIVAVASGSVPGSGSADYAVTIQTDAEGRPSGSIVFERGGVRLVASDLCRVWGHVPGEPTGQCPDAGSAEGATVLHAVGIGSFTDGAEVVVRTDIRETKDGRYFRVRWGARDTSREDAGATGQPSEACGEGWTRYPDGGWATLDTLTVQVGDGG
jgi:hypothetical protein